MEEAPSHRALEHGGGGGFDADELALGERFEEAKDVGTASRVSLAWPLARLAVEPVWPVAARQHSWLKKIESLI